MGNASGVSPGDRNRNARLARLREFVPNEHAIVGIDLADSTRGRCCQETPTHDELVRGKASVSGSWSVSTPARRTRPPESPMSQLSGGVWRCLWNWVQSKSPSLKTT